MARLGRSKPAKTYLYLGRPARATGGPQTRGAALTVTPSFSTTTVLVQFRTAALTVTPSFSAGTVLQQFRTAALTVTPTFHATGTNLQTRTAALTVTPSFTAAAGKVLTRTAALTVTPSFTASGAKVSNPITASWIGSFSRDLLAYVPGQPGDRAAGRAGLQHGRAVDVRADHLAAGQR